MEEAENNPAEEETVVEESTTALENDTDLAAVDTGSKDVGEAEENIIQSNALSSEVISRGSVPNDATESVEGGEEAMEDGAEAMEDTHSPVVEHEFLEGEKNENEPEVCLVKKSKEKGGSKPKKSKQGLGGVTDSDRTKKQVPKEYIDLRARALRQSGTAQFPEIFFKKASAVGRDLMPSAGHHHDAASVLQGAKGVCNRLDVETVRLHIQECRNLCTNQYQPNPACSVPMRAKGQGRRLRAKQKPVEEWRMWEERDRDKRDHELAIQLGYETLVGNILYIDIPGGRDINRSWHSFLSEDVMEWGFPYKKGSIERPRMKLPQPYLAHQMREKLWKFPRSRTLQATQED